LFIFTGFRENTRELPIGSYWSYRGLFVALGVDGNMPPLDARDHAR